MELIYIKNTNGVYDNGLLHNYEIDFDITTDRENTTNDFELKMALPDSVDDLLWVENETSSLIFIEGTEYGGEIMGSVIDIVDNTVTYTGRTWRGTFSEYIIEPPAGQDYLVVTGNLADIISDLPLYPLMQVAPTTYSLSTQYQFDRYITVFEGLEGLVSSYTDTSLRLTISFEQTEGQYTGTATATLEPVRDLSDWIEVSQDYSDHVQLKITKDGTTPRRLICLGQGELRDRQVVNLYADEDWNVSTTPISGAYPVEVYDYSSSDALEADGRKKFAEYIANHEQIDVNISDLDVLLGDIIAAKDNLTGETVQAEITNIVYKCTDYGDYQTESYDYKTKVRI